jgi:hypothetical protein
VRGNSTFSCIDTAKGRTPAPGGSIEVRPGQWMGLKLRCLRRHLLVSCLLLALAALDLGAEPPPLGKTAPEWDALFQRDSGWIGADGDYSIPLGGDRTLWLYSDSFVGQVKDGKRTETRMINNSIALQQGTNRPEFFYGKTRDGKPASFITPQHGRAHGYFWLGHGVRTGSGLYFFAHQVVTVHPGSPFGFKMVDGWLAHVANPDSPPSQWRITQTQVPFTKISAKGALIFGGAVLREGDSIYVFGGDSRPEAKKAGVPNGLVVARVPADKFGDFKQWRFLAKGEWQKDYLKVTPVFPNVGSEYSVSWLAALKQYAAVYSEGIGGRILVRLSPAITGPWGDAFEVYRCPEMGWSPKVFCYAAKAHPELATAPDELLITYAANSWNFWELFNDPRLYWPRFLRVTLKPD